MRFRQRMNVALAAARRADQRGDLVLVQSSSVTSRIARLLAVVDADVVDVEDRLARRVARRADGCARRDGRRVAPAGRLSAPRRSSSSALGIGFAHHFCS